MNVRIESANRAYTGQLQLINSRGQIVDVRPINVLPGTQVCTVPVESLPAGVYFLKFRLGDNTQVCRFSKL